MRWLPVYRCRLCAREWTGAYSLGDLPERVAVFINADGWKP